jgi:RNA polymerase sigma factor for flagellar operon FliA
MVQLHRVVSAPGFRLDVSVEGLVRTIAHRRCVDWMRRLRPLDDDPPDSVSTAPSPEDNVLADERLRRVREAFSALGYSCRRIIGLRVGEGLSYKDVASRMDSTEASIRVRMHRCLKRLRTLVDPPESRIPREAEGED